ADIRRAGFTSRIPRTLVDAVHEHYLSDAEHARIPREPLADAWAWATRRRNATTALLHVDARDRIDVFDYLVDHLQLHAPPGQQVPEYVVRAAVDSADPADADSLATAAYAEGRYVLAEYAWRRAWRAQADNPALGAEHLDTATSRSRLALVLGDLGRLAEAEA